MLRPKPAARSAVSMTARAPGTSTATGFSMNRCLRASMTAFMCIGRKCGGVAWITRSTPESSSFWYASNPVKHFDSSICCPRCSLSSRRPSATRSGNTSASATIWRLGPASRKFWAAPRPRPPHPISPAFRTGPSGALTVASFAAPGVGAVWARGVEVDAQAVIAAAPAAATDPMNARRLMSGLTRFILCSLPGYGFSLDGSITARTMNDRRMFLKALAAAVAAASQAGRADARQTAQPGASASAPSKIRKSLLISLLPKDRPYADRFAMAREAGFDAIEMQTIGKEDEAAEIKQAAQTAGLRIHSVMNMEHWQSPLSSSDPDVVTRSVHGMETSLRNAKL